jgi:hypothetical protein
MDRAERRRRVHKALLAVSGMDATRRFMADLQRAMTKADWTVDLLAVA